jgi:hypothetical protein
MITHERISPIIKVGHIDMHPRSKGVFKKGVLAKDSLVERWPSIELKYRGQKPVERGTGN